LAWRPRGLLHHTPNRPRGLVGHTRIGGAPEAETDRVARGAVWRQAMRRLERIVAAHDPALGSHAEVLQQRQRGAPLAHAEHVEAREHLPGERAQALVLNWTQPLAEHRRGDAEA